MFLDAGYNPPLAWFRSRMWRFCVGEASHTQKCHSPSLTSECQPHGPPFRSLPPTTTFLEFPCPFSMPSPISRYVPLPPIKILDVTHQASPAPCGGHWSRRFAISSTYNVYNSNYLALHPQERPSPFIIGFDYSTDLSTAHQLAHPILFGVSTAQKLQASGQPLMQFSREDL
ncbi:hypothetical protein B0H17DRAFT_1097198 [Mycena rosella]|uniref:Uncharacterized protein n=1 Tax=Mycena rosella TaxID=1033263 RepID=A0AAD7CSV2_MYCRO|nr:hypothetical protein B0H17DRAFT_1097198 [Mycena rosella]